MGKKSLRAAASALLVLGFGAACQAAPSLHAAVSKAVKAIQADADDGPQPYEWMLPSIIQSGLIQRGVSGFAGFTGADFQGRKLNVTQVQATAGITDQVELFYGEEFILAQGRSSSSRFDVANDYYGGRVVVKRPTAKDPEAWSAQFEAIRPDTASATISGSAATYEGTDNNIYSVNYQDRIKNQYQLEYSDVSVVGGLYAHVLTLGAGRDYQLSDTCLARVQVSLIGETYQGLGISGSDVKPMVYGALAFTPAPWISLEADVTGLPAGMPYAGGEFTGLSSFALYNPGGIVNDLRSDFVAFGSLRLLLHGKF